MDEQESGQLTQHHPIQGTNMQPPVAEQQTSRATTAGRVGAEQPGGTRRHMGVATSDPTYLPPTQAAAAQPSQPLRTVNAPAHPRSGKQQLTHSSRYLETPKSGRSIFTSQRERQKKRNRAIAAAIIMVVALAVATWFFLH